MKTPSIAVVIRQLSIALATAIVAQAAPVLTDAVLTDVSPCAFKVVWQSSGPAAPSVQVFTDALGTIPAAAAITQIYAGLDDYTQVLLSNAGIMSVDVRGLAPDTVFYVRATSTALADSSVASTALLSVRTAVASSPFTSAAPFAAVTNPVLRFNCLSPDGRHAAETGLLLAQVSGARTPVVQAVTDDTTVFLEAANLISSATGRTLPVLGNETLTLKFYRGLGQVETFNFFMPVGDQLATVEDPRLTSAPLTATEIQPVAGSDGVARVFLEFPVTPGNYYNVESSPTLGSWTEMERGLRSTDARLFWEDSGLREILPAPADSRLRFYRLVPYTP